MNKRRTSVLINTRDRPTELYGLLLSLQQQTYQDFDIFIFDDASGTPIVSFHFLNCIFERLRQDGHYVDIKRNDKSKGVSWGRQQLVNHARKSLDNEFLCRLDDDIVVEPDYLSLLLQGIEQHGYDLMSGVTPPMGGAIWKREIRFVEPIINRVVLDDTGSFMINADDCGHAYIENDFLPMHHFRSCALYRSAIHEKVNYEEVITPCGFREEEFFSFRMILAGYTLGACTGATAWHLCTPSGGDRRSNYQEMARENQRMLNVFTKKAFNKVGNFIEAYNQKLGIVETPESKFATLNKNTNLIFSKEE